jgi:NAD(P)-dependent dehydrogenase (short-subunit alcohol dehydrogenase family)
VVTGASRGLGAGIANRFVELGIAVGCCARHEPMLPAGRDGVLGAAVDVRDPAAVDAFARRVTAELGPIDLWVNNAGVLDPIGPLRDGDVEALRAHVEVNVLGVLWGSRTFARLVHDRPNGGTLVNISSGAARTVYQGWAAYCASKAAVEQLSRVLAAEEADHGLRVVALAPGVVDTDMQATIRATDVDRFPSVERFHALKADDAFNSPAWVADRILDLTGPTMPKWVDASSEPVVLRIPDEPRP